jgi:hypothetical protein
MFGKSKTQRIQLLTFSLISIPIVGQADQCRYIENDKERLACYDSKSGRGFDTVKQLPQPLENYEVDRETETVPVHKQSKKRLFGIPKPLNSSDFSKKKPAGARENNRANVLSFSSGSDGKVVIETDRGTYQLLERVRRTSNHEKEEFILLRDKGVLGTAIRFGNLNGWHKVKKIR